MAAPRRSTLLLTGATGFVGKAVLATLLRRDACPRLLVLLRAPDADAARRRLEAEVLTAEPFAALPAAAAALADGSLRAVAGDLDDGRFEPADASWGEVETVVHCAASVSFEAPLDEILAVNAFGPVRLLESLREAGARPHFVHVSTAYAAECRRATVGEDGPLHPRLAELDPGALMEEARGWRASAAGADGAALERELSARGRRRALAAGWPDTFALTKALGERLLGERAERLTIVRPTIIESALRQPRPGWLEGIKVADPLVLAYAAGGLTHLAGRASNRIDIVPVDHVANACVAAALYPPEDGRRAIAVASSARNPLAIGELAGQIRTHFRAEPLRRRNGVAIPIGELSFVPRRRALARATARQRLAATAAALAPRGRARAGRRASLAAQVTRMVGIYAPYTELDCAFDDANAQALAASMSPADRAALPFDAAEIDWSDYLQRTHLPAVHALAERRPSAKH